MVSSPQEWLKRYASNAYRSCWNAFEKWLDSKGLTWQEVLTKQPSEIRNLIDEHLLEITSFHTTKSVRSINSIIRSFFSFNDLVIPKPRISLIGGKAATVGKLNPQILREMIYGSKPKLRSFLLFKFQSLQDNARMLWISRNGWSQIKPQLDKGGWTDRKRKIWPDIVRIVMPHDRKKNPDPYFCFVGKEAIEALKKYLEIRGEPKKGELIWKDLSNVDSITRLTLRIGRRIGHIPLEAGEDSGVRYGFNIHEMRDVARSLWHESGADLSVAEFAMGHSIDKMGYDKIMTLSPDYAVKAFLKAEPFLNILESGRATAEAHEEEIKKLQQQIQKRDEATLEVIDRIRKLEERLAQVRATAEESEKKV